MPSANKAAPGRLVHGMGHDLVTADWPELTEEEVKGLLARIPQLAASGPVRLLWHSPRPFSSTALVSAPPHRLVVKRHAAALRSVGSLEAEHSFVRHLASRGLPAAPALDDGSCSAWQEGSFVYEVQKALDGLDLYAEAPSWTPFISVQHAANAGAALAQLHVVSSSYQASPRPVEALHASAQVVSTEDPLAATEALADELPGLGGYLAEAHSGRKGPWRRQLLQALGPFHEAFLPYAPGLVPLWGHNDWHPSNLLWSSDSPAAGVAGVIDFGLANQTSACYDLATAIERSVVAWLRPPERRAVHEDHMRALVDGYVSRRRLAPLEAAALEHLLPLVHVDYALSEVDYFWRVVRSPERAHLAWDAYLLGHLRWWASPPGRRLLAEVARQASLAVGTGPPSADRQPSPSPLDAPWPALAPRQA